MKAISKLQKAGLSAQVRPNGKLFVTPKDRITPEMRAFIKENLDELKKGAKRIREHRLQTPQLPMHLRMSPAGQIARQIIQQRIPHFALDYFNRRMESKDHGGCGCKTMETRMDDVGVEGIIREREIYEDHFAKQVEDLPAGFLLPKSARQRLGKWLVDLVIEEATASRAKIHPEVCVITACDHDFLRGAYYLAWTLLHLHDVKMRVYDLGIDRRSPMFKDMQSWGVEFHQFHVKHADFDGWQTLNKPWYIRDAMSKDPVVVWLDSDVAVAGSIEPMVESIKQSPFVPDHGFHESWYGNRNPSGLYSVMPRPLRDWGIEDPFYYPCAGILGFNSARDRLLIESWMDRIDHAVEKNVVSLYKYYDQGVLQDLYDGPLADGKIWNNLRGHRLASVSRAFSQLAEDDTVLYHYGGSVKPWMKWATMRWPNPAYIKERHDRPHQSEIADLHPA